MQRLIIVAFSLSLGLAALSGAVPVQAQGPVVYDDAVAPTAPVPLPDRRATRWSSAPICAPAAA
jgi:hypothetical protein